MKIINELFRWLKYEFICPHVRALNATIFVHSTPRTIICKEYCAWKLQMSYLADLSTNSYILILERWMLPFSYIQRATVFMGRYIVHKDNKWVFFSLFKHEFICPDVRALNATIVVHSTPKTIIGKEYSVWRLQISYLADSSSNSYILIIERWMLAFSYIQRTRLLLERNIVYEDCKWVI